MILGGGWTNPVETYYRQNGFIFPKVRGENWKIFELPPPSFGDRHPVINSWGLVLYVGFIFEDLTDIFPGIWMFIYLEGWDTRTRICSERASPFFSALRTKSEKGESLDGVCSSRESSRRRRQLLSWLETNILGMSMVLSKTDTSRK